MSGIAERDLTASSMEPDSTFDSLLTDTPLLLISLTVY